MWLAKETTKRQPAHASALLRNTNFATALPIDAQLEPSHEVSRLVPYPGYFDGQAEKLTPDQQAEYLKAFRDGDDFGLGSQVCVGPATSGLILSAIYCLDRCDLASCLVEVEALAVRIQPKCSEVAPPPVKEILGVLSAFNE